MMNTPTHRRLTRPGTMMKVMLVIVTALTLSTTYSITTPSAKAQYIIECQASPSAPVYQRAAGSFTAYGYVACYNGVPASLGIKVCLQKWNGLTWRNIACEPWTGYKYVQGKAVNSNRVTTGPMNCAGYYRTAVYAVATASNTFYRTKYSDWMQPCP
jgi:hypothetical protein